MRIGVMIDTEQSLDGQVAQVVSLRDAGIGSAWMSQIFGYDSLTALAVVGQEVPGIELGTAVVPTYPRHPVMLAGQALTVQAASGGRLTLGIGLSHQLVIENVFGQSFDKPVRHMREYLSILVPVLRGEQVTFVGETLSASTFGPLDIDASAPDVLVAALGTAMLHIAGRMASGTVTWMTGPTTIESHVIPTISAAAAGGGSARTPDRGGSASVRDHRRGRRPDQGLRALSPCTDISRPIGPCSTARGWTVRPMSPSSAPPVRSGAHRPLRRHRDHRLRRCSVRDAGRDQGLSGRDGGRPVA